MKEKCCYFPPVRTLAFGGLNDWLKFLKIVDLFFQSLKALFVHYFYILAVGGVLTAHSQASPMRHFEIHPPRARTLAFGGLNDGLKFLKILDLFSSY